MVEHRINVAELPPLPPFEHDWEIGQKYQFRDLGIVIEFKAGDTRTKTRDNGAQVSNIMPSAYGFILGTTDIHGEEIDMYLAPMPNPDSDIYVIDQINPSTGLFDEHKVMLGFDSIDEVVTTYTQVFGDGSGPRRIGAITTFPGASFYLWMATEGYFTEPASKYTDDLVTVQTYVGIAQPQTSGKYSPKPIDETGGIQIALPDLSKGPKIYTSASPLGGLTYTIYLYGPLLKPVWSNLIDRFCRTLYLATEKDVVNIRIASPGGCVFMMGRIVSAIRATKATVTTYAQGPVASAATTVWAAGHVRHILPGAYFMQHMSSQSLEGKTTDIVAKAIFCRDYILRQLQPLQQSGLYTQREVDDMVYKSSDIFISGREAIDRVGIVSYSRTGDKS